MISDAIELTGRRAYFAQSTGGALDLVAGSSGVQSFATAPLPIGLTWLITGLDLTFTANAITDLTTRRDNPFLTISVIRELLPGYYGDPFCTRIHSIAGAEDFDAGTVQGGSFTEFAGAQTLVANDAGLCRWVSAPYRYPQPIDLNCFAWDLPISMRAVPQTLLYSISLNVTQANGITATVPLASNADASTPRWKDGLGLIDLTEIQIVFEAMPGLQGDVSTIRRGRHSDGVGMPVLRGFSALENITSPLAFYALSDLLATGRIYPDPDLSRNGPQTMAFSSSLNAVLSESEAVAPGSSDFERIELVVDTDLFSLFEARLNGTEEMRPDLAGQDG